MPSKKWYFALPIIIIYIGLAWMLYSYFKNSIDAQTNALKPVIALPTINELISFVPS